MTEDSGLRKYRKEIDRIDDEILKLLNQRCEVVRSIGALKEENGTPVFVPEREREIFNRLDSGNSGPLTPEAMRAIYREIMAAARELERPMIVAYLGPEGTFSHEAARKRFSSQTQFDAQRTIFDVFSAVECYRADYGCVPVENSTEGVVTSTLDRIFGSTLKICSEVYLPIHHHLAGQGTLETIKKVYSHPQVLGQCRNFLHEHCHQAEIIESSSTAQAAKTALAEGAESAALCGKIALELTGLPTIMANVEDSAYNTTRFLVIGRQQPEPTGNDKTSLCLGMPDKVGALYSALEPFKKAKISLTMIESRPSKVESFSYSFFADIIGHKKDPEVKQALQEAQAICSFVKVLGSYPRGND